MTSRKSKSWIQVMSDWMPKWPKRKTVNQLTMSGLDDGIQFSKVPDRYAKGDLNKSAPAVLTENQKGYPGSNMTEKFTMGRGDDSDDEYYDTSFEFSPVITTKHSTPYRGNRERKIITNGVGNTDMRLRPETKEWVPDIDQEWLQRQNRVVLLKPKLTGLSWVNCLIMGMIITKSKCPGVIILERVGYRNKMTKRPNKISLMARKSIGLII